MRQARVAVAEVLAALTLVAGVLAVYAGVVALTTVVQTGTLTLGRPAPVPVLLATLVVALVVQPMHRRLRQWTGYAVGVATTDPFDLLRRLPRSVTAELSAEDIPPYMARVLAEGLRTSWCELWLRVPSGYQRAARWPAADEAVGREVAGSRGVVPATGPGERCHPVVHGGETTGMFRVCHDPPRELSGLERRLLTAYADQSGQVVRMLALRAALQQRQTDLAYHAEALREANAQLVEARAVERRLVERDLHDGGQQQLLVLALGVEVARQQAARSDPASRDTLERAGRSAEQARAGLVRLSDGLGPRMLATHGLAVALRAAVSGLVIPVLVRVGDDGDGGPVMAPPMPMVVAEALFYVAMEATQNATKHAGSPDVVLDVVVATGRWSVVVTDRGCGFDPVSATPGAGLTGMDTRMRAVAGRLEVTSTPGAGTRVSAAVPWCGDGACRVEAYG